MRRWYVGVRRYRRRTDDVPGGDDPCHRDGDPRRPIDGRRRSQADAGGRSLPDPQIREAVTRGVLASLWINPSTLEIEVRDGIVTLAGRLQRRSTAAVAVAFTRAMPGVVDVVGSVS